MVVKTLFLGLAAVSLTLVSASTAQGSNAQPGDGSPGIVQKIGDEYILTPGALSGSQTTADEDIAATASVVADGLNNGIPAITEAMKEHRDLMPIVFELAARVDSMKASILRREGPDALYEKVKKDLVQIDPLPGMGRAEIKLVEDRVNGQVNRAYITRVVLEKNSVAYYLVNEGEVAHDSKHLRQILARNRVDAGPVVVRDANGQPVKNIFGKVKLTNGRDAMVIWLNSGITAEHDWQPKSKTLSKGWWRDRWNAWVQKPTSASFSMALFWGVAVGGSQTALLSWMTTGAVDWDVVAWNSGFGLGIGTFISTYRNVINSGYSRLVRAIKGQPVSLTHSFGTIILIGDKHCRDGSQNSDNCELEDRFSSINIMTEDGLQRVASLGVSEVADSFAGDYWNQLGVLLEVARLNANPVKPLTWLAKTSGVTALTGWKPKKDLDWNRASFTSQLIRAVGPSGLSMLQRFTIGATENFQLPGTNLTMPVFQVAGMPVALSLSKYLARKLADDAKERAEQSPELLKQARELEEASVKLDQLAISDRKLRTQAKHLRETAESFRKRASDNEMIKGKAEALERLAQKYEAQWAGSFGLAVDPWLQNHWQADPLVETTLRATHLGMNVTEQVGKLLHASHEKASVVATSAASFATRKLGPKIQSVKECGRLIRDVLNTPLDQLEIPGITPRAPFKPSPK